MERREQKIRREEERKDRNKAVGIKGKKDDWKYDKNKEMITE